MGVLTDNTFFFTFAISISKGMDGLKQGGKQNIKGNIFPIVVEKVREQKVLIVEMVKRVPSITPSNDGGVYPLFFFV